MKRNNTTKKNRVSCIQETRIPNCPPSDWTLNVSNAYSHQAKYRIKNVFVNVIHILFM